MSDKIKIGDLAQTQMEVEAAKFGPVLEHERISRAINLPSGYGRDRIVAMVRDPWWLFVYWEITPQNERATREKIHRRGQEFKESILRVYDITGISNFEKKGANRYFDIRLKDMARNWYVDVGWPDRRFYVEIGMLSKQGDFYALARSNIVQTPPFGMSDILDKTWMISEEEYWRLFGISGGFDLGKSSLEMKELWQKRIKEWVSSGGIVSLGSHLRQQKC